MWLRRHRRNVVVWSSSGHPAGRPGIGRYRRPARTGQARRFIRIGVLLTVIAVRPRWLPLLAGTVLLLAGVIERNGAVAVVIIPGLLMFWQALLIPGDTDANCRRRAQLAGELAAFSTPAQRRDLGATLDRFPDGVTDEMREILLSQASR
jgi:hypothetical protein